MIAGIFLNETVYRDARRPDPDRATSRRNLIVGFIGLALLLQAFCTGCCLLAMGDRPPQEWLKEQWNAPIPPDTRPLAPEKEYR